MPFTHKWQLNQLQTILLDKTVLYLTEDNPLPRTNGEKVISLFSMSGETGRIRANQFMNQVIYSCTHWELLDKVIKAINFEDATLKNSTKYRRRIMEGICEAMNVTEEMVNDKITHYMMGWARAASLSLNQALPPNRNQIRDQIMLEYINNYYHAGLKIYESAYPKKKA